MIRVKRFCSLSKIVQTKSCGASSKPPVCRIIVAGRTAKGTIYCVIIAKIIFILYWPLASIETFAYGGAAVSVQIIIMIFLPPRQITITALMATGIHIFHSLTNIASQKFYDVEIYEFSSDVINIVNTMGWKAAGRSPVSGLGTKVIHHAQTHSVFVPVWKIIVHGGICRKWHD